MPTPDNRNIDDPRHCGLSLDDDNVGDRLLERALHRLRERSVEPSTGIVVAALKEPGGAEDYATSSLDPVTHRWIHAERNLLLSFRERHGRMPSKNSIVAISLSPCSRVTSQTRLGPSCVSVLVDAGLSRVHVGAIDAGQVGSLQPYVDAGLNVALTRRTDLREICEVLSGQLFSCDNKVEGALLRAKGVVAREIRNRLSRDPSAP